MNCSCLENIKHTMLKWSAKTWLYMLIHQGEFEADLNDCDSDLSQCFTIFTVSTLCQSETCRLGIFQTAAQMESLGDQHERGRWQMNLKESHDADHKAVMKRLADVNFMQQVIEARLTENHNDTRTILMTMQQVCPWHI